MEGKFPCYTVNSSAHSASHFAAIDWLLIPLDEQQIVRSIIYRFSLRQISNFCGKLGEQAGFKRREYGQCAEQRYS